MYIAIFIFVFGLCKIIFNFKIVNSVDSVGCGFLFRSIS